MSIVLVGGMDRLGEKYQDEARRFGMDLQIFSQAGQKMETRIKKCRSRGDLYQQGFPPGPEQGFQ